MGGLGLSAFYFDLDLKFCATRFLQLMQHRFVEKRTAFVEMHGQASLDDHAEMESMFPNSIVLIFFHLI
jgi:hypothetical protein